MKPKPLPEAAYLRECFSYDEGTGILRWKVRPLHHFKSVTAERRWNRRWPGTIAGTSMTDGYVGVHVNKGMFKAQRVIWVIQTGAIPKKIDHKNGDPSDNRWENLREATTQQNRWNGRHSVTPMRGVYVTRTGKRYEARLAKNRTVRYLGTYDTPEEAYAAWQAAAREERGEFFRAD